MSRRLRALYAAKPSVSRSGCGCDATTRGETHDRGRRASLRSREQMHEGLVLAAAHFANTLA
eukprot:3295639-Pleurochrysis_carterae.AAC.2